MAGVTVSLSVCLYKSAIVKSANVRLLSTRRIALALQRLECCARLATPPRQRATCVSITPACARKCVATVIMSDDIHGCVMQHLLNDDHLYHES